MFDGKLVIDLFAGGGGASEGIRMVIGHGPDIAVDISPEAVRFHAVNNPTTKHFCTDIWCLDPIKATGGKPVALLWASPPCTHFSRARAGRKKEKVVRSLAWSVCRWAASVRPDTIIMENVTEFLSWGPLGRQGRPVKAKKGATFEKFVSQLEGLEYRVEWRFITAADLGVPTMRKRLFLVARRDRAAVVWPEPTHGPVESIEVLDEKLFPYTGVYTKARYLRPCQSIFGRIRKDGGTAGQLAKKTVERAAKGVRRFVIDNPSPFTIRRMDGSADAFFIIQQQGNSVGTDIRNPLNTITAGGMGHMYLAVVRLMPAGGWTEHDARDNADIHSQCCEALFPEPVQVQGRIYKVADIRMRILDPDELYGCQGFPESYTISRYSDGEPVPKTEQVERCGNAVCPPVAAALVRANLHGLY